MTKPTSLALGIFLVLIVGAAIVASLGPKDSIALPMNEPKASKNPQVINLDGTTATLPVLADRMPEFQGITKWWNTEDGEALTAETLKGKVVLIDFWTYSCINCIRTYPFIKAMHEKYADKGLVIVGVHTPEFAFEANPENVEREIKKNGLKHPIALDAKFGTWSAYANHYWPAEYFFDRQGRLRHTHFGEGEYGESEEVIRALLEENGMTLGAPVAGTVPTQDFSKIQTPETYFGLSRGKELMGQTPSEGMPTKLNAAASVEANKWTAGGTWTFREEYAQADSANATFRFNVQAAKLHLVLEAADGKDKTLEIFVDGKKTGETTVNRSTLYDIASFPDAARHTVEIRIKEAGVRFYAATFS